MYVTVSVTEQVTHSATLNMQLHKKRILDEWWRILTDFTVPDKPEDVIRRTANSLHFVYKVCSGCHGELTTRLLFPGCNLRYSRGISIPSGGQETQATLPQAASRGSQTKEDPTEKRDHVTHHKESRLRADHVWSYLDEIEVKICLRHCQTCQILVPDGSLQRLR